MPEYLAPGVFVEETSFTNKSIGGVCTTTTGFVGPTRSGPCNDVPELLTSFKEFERIYGGLHDLAFTAPAPATNFVAHAVAAYFSEGGTRLYVARAAATASTTAAGSDLSARAMSRFISRFPGAAGNGRILIREDPVPTTPASATELPDGSFLRVNGIPITFFVKRSGVWRNSADADATATISTVPHTTSMDVLTYTVVTIDADGRSSSYEALGLDPQHERFIGNFLTTKPTQRSDQVSQMFAFNVANTVTPVELRAAFAALPLDPRDPDGLFRFITLGGGTDVPPTEADYQAPLEHLRGLEDISIIAAPGHSHVGFGENFNCAVASRLVTHAAQRRSFRFAVLDAPNATTPSTAVAYKARIDSKFASLYTPWVVVPNPNFDPNDPRSEAELVLPPSGFVCGIYARSDIERGVHKAPANEVVRTALRFESRISTGEQELLNPMGVNCLRSFPGRGHRVWGARTTSSDPEWKYVNVCRYLLYLEQSIDRGTQWAVFEPNGERLWANVREAVSSFLFKEWGNGALLGDKPVQAFFVKCDRSTMTQNDLDDGRLVCLIGVAVTNPAEFVIFRIAQKTAEVRP